MVSWSDLKLGSHQLQEYPKVYHSKISNLILEILRVSYLQFWDDIQTVKLPFADHVRNDFYSEIMLIITSFIPGADRPVGLFGWLSERPAA